MHSDVAYEVRHVLASLCGPGHPRKMVDAGSCLDRDLWIILGELGWLGASIPPSCGGSGDGYPQLCAVAEAIGRTAAVLPLAPSLALGIELLMLAGTPAQQQQWLPRLARGASIPCLAVAEGIHGWQPDDILTRCEGGALSGRKEPVTDGLVADIALVAATEGGSLSLYLLELEQPEAVRRSPMASGDPTRSQALLELHQARAELMVRDAWPLLVAAFDRAAVIVAFEQLGVAEQCLQTARGAARRGADAAERKLRDMEIAVGLARAHCDWAAWSLAQGAPDLAHAAAAAQASAAHAAHLCARENLRLQQSAEIEADFDGHLYLRRAQFLAGLLNGVAYWRSRWIDRLQAETTAT